MERQDLDALLIGALYGELTPAEESRLAAHLESHPADRGALDDLKSARQKIHDSRIFAVQVEPPQAISAVLLQEAHRRAPKRVAAGTESEKESWFARFAKSFMSHPAMAAAAMLVLVMGGAGIVWMKKGDSQFASKEYTSSPATTDRSLEKDTGAVAPGSAAFGTAAPAAEPAPGAGAPAGADLEKQLDGNAGSAYNAQLYESEGGARAELAKSEAPAQKRARAQAQAKTDPSSITVGSVERTPKDFDKNDEQRADRPVAKKSASKGTAGAGESLDGDAFDDSVQSNAVSGAGRIGGGNQGYAQPPSGQATATGATFDGAGGGAATTTTAPRKAPAPSAATSSSDTKETQQKAKTSAAPKPTTPTTAGKQSGAAPVAPPPPPQAAPKMEATAEVPAAPEAKPEPKRDDSSLLSWAKSEHARAVTLAKNSECTAAAKVALSVSNRAPGYYSEYMATDRQLKSCAQYISAERAKAANKATTQKATDTK